MEGFFNGTAHYTIDPGATADLGFNGTAVRVIGDCNTDHGQFTVTIDGVFQGWYDAWCNEQRPREVLFETDSLTAGSHTIEIAASGVQDGQATGITDPELGSMVPDDLFTLDAIQYGNFGVNEINTTSAPQPTTSGVPGPGSIRLGKASSDAAARAFLVSVHAAASDRVTARVGVPWQPWALQRDPDLANGNPRRSACWRTDDERRVSPPRGLESRRTQAGTRKRALRTDPRRTADGGGRGAARFRCQRNGRRLALCERDE